MVFNFTKVKARMVECNITGAQMAKGIGITPASFSAKINGKRQFTLAEFYLMCKVLDILDRADEFLFVVKF